MVCVLFIKNIRLASMYILTISSVMTFTPWLLPHKLHVCKHINMFELCNWHDNENTCKCKIVVFNGVSKLLTTQPFIIIFPQILMSVQQCQDHVMLMLTAPTLMEVLSAPAKMDTLEVECSVQVN